MATFVRDGRAQLSSEKSIHFICERLSSGNLKGLHLISKNPNVYLSESWGIKAVDALLGGWVYFHQAKAQHSELGGKILRVEDTKILSVHGHPDIAIVFEARREGRNQKWRGAAHGMAWTGGLVDANLPHERQFLNQAEQDPTE